MPKASEGIRQGYDTNIKAKTGVGIADWLKAEHGLGHACATLLTHDGLHREAEHSILIA
ncbi:hypothetical protein GCM10022631_03890 [Deinococcus rubellus]|uniref:DUF4287 domain-containing protein n=1 Tax=Deinococcus rubellus TaxID=1889240 RepID=A0ABY5YE62_9DEIO|nr:DUF4287 domain-containing protein [Deinococcus rubellus]UWX63334.1 DUF4287 domain-containing protein [Deinococcus rubellus]